MNEFIKSIYIRHVTSALCHSRHVISAVVLALTVNTQELTGDFQESLDKAISNLHA